MKNKTIEQHVKMKKIMMGLITAILFMFLCIGQSAHAQAKTYKISSANKFHKISTYKGGTFKLTKDIKLTKVTQYLTINKNKTYTIDLNGHKITANTYTSGQIRDDVPIIVIYPDTIRSVITMETPSPYRQAIHSVMQAEQYSQYTIMDMPNM